jgi:hypothetical protein
MYNNCKYFKQTGIKFAYNGKTSVGYCTIGILTNCEDKIWCENFEEKMKDENEKI